MVRFSIPQRFTSLLITANQGGRRFDESPGTQQSRSSTKHERMQPSRNGGRNELAMLLMRDEKRNSKSVY
jgi:hypothetical protein